MAQLHALFKLITRIVEFAAKRIVRGVCRHTLRIHPSSFSFWNWFNAALLHRRHLSCSYTFNYKMFFGCYLAGDSCRRGWGRFTLNIQCLTLVYCHASLPKCIFHHWQRQIPAITLSLSLSFSLCLILWVHCGKSSPNKSISMFYKSIMMIARHDVKHASKFKTTPMCAKRYSLLKPRWMSFCMTHCIPFESHFGSYGMWWVTNTHLNLSVTLSLHRSVYVSCHAICFSVCAWDRCTGSIYALCCVRQCAMNLLQHLITLSISTLLH